MRLFIAIPIPDEIKVHISLIQDEFSKYPLRFVKLEQMHLTIDFLGEISDNKVDGIIKSLDNIKSKPFNIRLTNLGIFPTKEKIRVIWIGIEKEYKFIELQKNIRKIFNHRGKLMPHLTIARAKDLVHDDLLNKRIKELEMNSISFPVDKFILYRSEFQKEGVVHYIVKEFYL
jgi:2'-5' RNA ligase